VTSATRTLSHIPVATTGDGLQLSLALHEVTGSSPGPTLGLTAGIHGDEPVGCDTVRRIVEQIEPAGLSGRVVALPVANPHALAAGTRFTPHDGENLNRVFPGDPYGTLTSQLAHAIWSSPIASCDFVIDFHSGGALATVDYAYLAPGHDDLSRAFLSELLFDHTPHAGSLGALLAERGIPTIVSEYGGGNQRSDAYVEKGVRGALNVMRHLGMLGGEPVEGPPQTVMRELRTVRPHHGGLCVSACGADRLGEVVGAGTELARVVDPQTFETLEVITATFDPSILVLGRTDVTPIGPGDYAFMLGNGATSAPVARVTSAQDTGAGVGV
jgi:predicted deacylase